MKTICKGIDLSEATTKVEKACSTRTTNPILESIKLTVANNSITLTATDGELTIQKSINADVLEEGSICIPGKYFGELVRKLENDDVCLYTEGPKLTIEYQNSECKILTLPAEDFPKVEETVTEKRFAIECRDLRDLINKTTFCCSQDDSRPILKGCLIEIKDGAVIFTAIDGYRLAVCKKNIQEICGEISIICPARALNEIGRMITGDKETINVYVQKNYLRVSIDNTVLTTRLYEGDFINASNIIPKVLASEVILDRKELFQSVERAAIMAKTEKTSLITMDITEDGMKISSIATVGSVDETIKILLEGKDVTISLNCKYVMDCIRAIDDEKVKIGLNSPITPCVITPVVGEEYLYLILPVRPH